MGEPSVRFGGRGSLNSSYPYPKPSALAKYGMLMINRQTLEQALRSIGLSPGDVVLLHSDLRPFGLPENTSSHDEVLSFYYEAFRNVLGPEGTLAVPAYFYEYARYGEPFDPDTSPVSKPLGVLSAYVNGLPGRVRSLNPLQSLAAIGAKAEELCGGESLAGYGVASPWHRLRILKGKIVFLGTTLQPMTYVHHIEQQYGVPHLYTKIYPYPVVRKGITLPGHPISAVRYLDYGIEYDLMPLQEEMDRRALLNKAMLGRGSIYAIDADVTFHVGIELLQRNPYFFLKRPPAFVPGKIPTDGITGKPKNN